MRPQSKGYQLEDLLFVLQRLRDVQGGCPWVQQQTAVSLQGYTLEEAYELVDAIDNGEIEDYCAELGDLLLQVVFHSQMAKEKEQFDFADVVDVLVNKMLQRNPHVFIDGDLNGRAESGTAPLELREVEQNWQKIKSRQQKDSVQGVLAEVPIAMPALMRAQKLQSKAAQLGFDWPELAPVIAKLDEEVAEFKQAMIESDSMAMAEELGDILFSAVNVARHCGLDAEIVLSKANQKFTKRFGYVEKKQNNAETELSLAQLEEFWQQAKTLEK